MDAGQVVMLATQVSMRMMISCQLISKVKPEQSVAPLTQLLGSLVVWQAGLHPLCSRLSLRAM